jgi:hypothetical protein
MGRMAFLGRVCFATATALAAGCQTHQRLIRQDEGVIVNDLRTVLMAEAAYEAANGGFPDTLQCLAAPQGCVPGYPKDAPSFLVATLANLVPENGYVRAFHPGPAAPSALRQSGVCSPSSLVAWAYTAVPATDRRKRKSFCVDSTQRMCATMDGGSPVVVNGQCGSPCQRIQ